MTPDDILGRIAKIADEIEAIKESLRPMNVIRRELAEIRQLVTAPRAVAIDNGLILAKLAFDDLILVIEQADRLIGPHLIMNGVYEKGLTAYFRSITQDITTFVDVGANIGYYTCLFGKQLRDRGRVFAFEPDPGNFAILQRNTQINWIDKRNIVVERLAVSNVAGTATLYRNVAKPGNTSLIAPSDVERQAQELVPFEVPVVTLDDYFEAIDGPIDLIKVDVEGYEFPILQGARKLLSAHQGLRLVLEWDPPRWTRIGVSAREVADFLLGLGFHASAVDSRGGLADLDGQKLVETPYANIVWQRMR